MNLRDTTLPNDEIIPRIRAMGNMFELRNGIGLPEVERKIRRHRISTSCLQISRKHGLGRKRHWFIASPQFDGLTHCGR